MEILTPEQVGQVYDVTDALALNRNWVVVPLAAREHPSVTVMPDGKILISPPVGESFDSWLGELRGRLTALDLSRTPRSSQHEPPRVDISPDAPPGAGARIYIDWENRSPSK